MDEVNSTESSQEVSNAESPLWQYVTKVEKPAGASVKSSGNTYFKCNLLWYSFYGSLF